MPGAFCLNAGLRATMTVDFAVTLLVFLHEAIPGGIQREAYEIIDAALVIEDD